MEQKKNDRKKAVSGKNSPIYHRKNVNLIK